MTSLTLAFASISAPFSTRYSTIGKWPFSAAYINGVYPNWYIHAHVHRFMCDIWVDSHRWHRLLYLLPPYQLLAQPDAWPLVNDHSSQHVSKGCIHADTFTDTNMCSCVTYVWIHINHMTSLASLSFASVSAPLSTRYSTTAKRPFVAACINGVYLFWYIHRYVFMCDVCVVSHEWYDITYTIILCLDISSFLQQILNHW